MTPDLERLFRISWKKNEKAYRYLGRGPADEPMTRATRKALTKVYCLMLQAGWDNHNLSLGEIIGMSAATATPTKDNADPNPKIKDRFWVVWSPQGGDPVVKIKTFEQAIHAAHRLSEKHPNQEFYVLQSCWGRKPKLVAENVTPQIGEESECPPQP